jgi:hypothetical protein
MPARANPRTKPRATRQGIQRAVSQTRGATATTLLLMLTRVPVASARSGSKSGRDSVRKLPLVA